MRRRAVPTFSAGSTQVITAGLLFTLAVIVAQTITQLIDFRFFDLRLSVLDSGHHASIFGAASILAQAVAAAAIGWCVLSRRRPAWLCVGVLVGALAAVRALMRYEPALERHELLILAAPLTLVAVGLCSLTLGETTRVRSVVWGSLLALGCSFLLHTVGPQADGTLATIGQATWAYQLTGMVKHGAELGGWMLLATGMVAMSTAGMIGPLAGRTTARS